MNKPQFYIGEKVVIWCENGNGIYDGLAHYIRGYIRRKDGTIAYALSQRPNEPPEGYCSEGKLLHFDTWQRMVARENALGKLWYK